MAGGSRAPGRRPGPAASGGSESSSSSSSSSNNNNNNNYDDDHDDDWQAETRTECLIGAARGARQQRRAPPAPRGTRAASESRGRPNWARAAALLLLLIVYGAPAGAQTPQLATPGAAANGTGPAGQVGAGGARLEATEAPPPTGTNLSPSSAGASSAAGGGASPAPGAGAVGRLEQARGPDGSGPVGSATGASGGGGAAVAPATPSPASAAPPPPPPSAGSITTSASGGASASTLGALLAGWLATDERGPPAPPLETIGRLTGDAAAPPRAQTIAEGADGGARGRGVEQQQQQRQPRPPAGPSLARAANASAADHQHNLQLANKVVCNSRCKCLIVELAGAANQSGGEINAAGRPAATSPTAPDGGQPGAGRPADEAPGGQLDKTLALFYADYSLDDDCEQLSPAGSGRSQPLEAERAAEQPAADGPPPPPPQGSLADAGRRDKQAALGEPAANKLAGQARPATPEPRPPAVPLYARFNQFLGPAAGPRFPLLGQAAAAGPEEPAAPPGERAPSYPAVYGHHHGRLHRQPPAGRPAAPAPPAPDQRLRVRRISPLRALDLSDGRLTGSGSSAAAAAAAAEPTRPASATAEAGAGAAAAGDPLLETQSRKLLELLRALASDNVQSLSLRNNDLKFEYLTQLYALLGWPLRRNLFHLDLSHNALVKLGVAFTGYIEHQLAGATQRALASQSELGAAKQLAESNWWPFNHANSANYSSDFRQQQQQFADEQQPGAGPRSFAAGQANLLGSGKQRLRLHPILGDGRLFNAVVRQLLLGELADAPTVSRTQLADLFERHFNFSAQLHQTSLVRALDLSHNKLKWLINDQFRALKHLQSIRLNSNRIRFIHQQAFNGLEALKYINLNSNRLQTIYVDQFQTNFNLQALMLRSNYLAYLRAGSFAAQARLKQLDLSRNKFAMLSNNAFAGLESLELLNLSSNQFVHVPSSSLHPMTSLARLDLSNNQLAQLVPGTFFHLTVEELALNDNEQLAAIERGAFWDLPYLRRLNLSSCGQLASVNSQAFVGTQSLQTIEAERCPSLDAATRRMLENITSAATARQLRAELSPQQPPQAAGKSGPASGAALVDVATTPPPPPPPPPPPVHLAAAANASAGKQLEQQQERLQAEAKQRPASPGWKYLHSALLVGLLAAALKFAFKFTATGSYLERRRRARRVYEASPGAPAGLSSRSCSPGSLGSIGSGGHGANRELADDDGDDDDDLSCSMADEPNAIALREQQPRIHVIELDRLAAAACPADGPEPAAQVAELADGYATGDNFGDVITQARQVQQQQQPPAGPSQFCPDCSPANLGPPGGPPLDQQQQQQPPPPPQLEPTDAAHQQPAGAPNNCCDQGQAPAGLLQLQPTPGQHPEHQQQRPPASEIAQQVGPGGPPAPAARSAATAAHLEAIRSQLVEAGFDYGHANCLHFYQSLGPALQLADLTANYVNSMDYYS